MEDWKNSWIVRVARGDIPRTWVKDSTPLDPRNAVTITMRELHELADVELGDEPDADELVHVPCIPINAREARAMWSLFNSTPDGNWYAGYTRDELEVVGGADI